MKSERTKNTTHLRIQTEFPMCDVTEYKQEAGSALESFLDPHHTHFILVDDTETGSEIDFRAKFESRGLYSGSNEHTQTDTRYDTNDSQTMKSLKCHMVKWHSYQLDKLIIAMSCRSSKSCVPIFVPKYRKVGY